nr:MAG TPA: hypothetical protein [Caudoviricetes sp.]
MTSNPQEEGIMQTKTIVLDSEFPPVHGTVQVGAEDEYGALARIKMLIEMMMMQLENQK